MKAFGIVALSALASMALAVPAGHAGGGQALFGPEYFSLSVEKDGEPRELVGNTRLQVKFARDGNRDAVRWESGCNLFGADAKISDSSIDTKEMIQTQMLCRKALMRQDRFFARFFAADPAYELQGRRLTLSTERVVVELRRPQE